MNQFQINEWMIESIGRDMLSGNSPSKVGSWKSLLYIARTALS